MAAKFLGPVMCSYDRDGDPVACMNRKYMGGKFLSNRQLCFGCEHEVSDGFTGQSTKKLFVGWYCTFENGE
jgi:hypothetical protein